MRVFQKKRQSKEQNVSTVDIKTNDVLEEGKTTSKEITTRPKRAPKSICRVIVAKPNYFVINKDGEVITVKKKNNYYKGEDIYY